VRRREELLEGTFAAVDLLERERGGVEPGLRRRQQRERRLRGVEGEGA